MLRLALLAGSFLLTFALLVAVWMIGTGRSPLAGLATTPSPAPTQAPTASPVTTLAPAPSATQAATVSPLATPSPTPSQATPLATPPSTPLATPSASPAPMRTLPPSFAPPSSQPGATQTYTLAGKDFSNYVVPDEASLLLNGDALVLRTTDDSTDALWVVYHLDPALLPAGATVHSVSVAMCGWGSGVFWEVYGPVGSDPLEYEVAQPEADGCWHFRDALTTDLTAIAATMLDSTLVIERVVFTVTFAG